MKLPEALFAILLALASAIVYFLRPELGDTRRWILALVAIGFFFAPLSAKPLRLAWWLFAVAVVCWGASLLTQGRGGLALWLVCSGAGAPLTVRAGSRAAHYYLPEAGNETGEAMRRSIRRELLVSVGLFLMVFVYDGWGRTEIPMLRGAMLLVSAAFFMRHILLQSKHLGVPSRPPLDRLARRSMVVAQRWPLLVLLTVAGATRLPDTILARAGSDTDALLVTSLLLLVLGALLFVLSLVRLQSAGRFSRGLVRRTSFLAGMALTVALAAVVVELEAWGPSRFTSFATICTFALVVLPFAHATTKLFGSNERLTFLVPPAILAVMLAPVAAINGERWPLASTGFLLAVALLMVVYFLVVTLRSKEGGALYLSASLAGLVLMLVSNGSAWGASGAAWKTFWIAFGLVVYTVDLLDRASAVAKLEVTAADRG